MWFNLRDLTLESVGLDRQMVCGSVGCAQGACKRRCSAKKIAVVHEEGRIKEDSRSSSLYFTYLHNFICNI